MCPEVSKSVQSVPKCPKMSINVQRVHSKSFKCPDTSKKVQKCPKITQNCGYVICEWSLRHVNRDHSDVLSPMTTKRRPSLRDLVPPASNTASSPTPSTTSSLASLRQNQTSTGMIFLFRELKKTFMSNYILRYLNTSFTLPVFRNMMK